MWSLACLVFELATGDLLFDPRAGKDYERDDDHLALVSELCGRVPRRVWSAGKRGKEFFNRAGELRRIRKLRFWPLDAVLREKYGFSKEEASFFFFSSLFSLFFVHFVFHLWSAKGNESENDARKKQSYCYDDQIKSFACYTVDSLFSSLLRIGGGMSQKNIDRAAESVFAFFSFSENKKKLTSIDKLSKKQKKKLTFNRPRPSPTS